MRIVRSTLLGSVAVISAFAGQADAQAPCTQWDVSGAWKFKQGSYEVRLTIEQSRKNLTGNAGLFGEEVSYAVGSGPVDGTIAGDQLNFSIFWAKQAGKNSSVGVYRGTIGPTGRIEGWTHDKRNPGSNAAWHSIDRMTCLSREQPATSDSSSPAAPAKKGKVLGKKKSTQKIDPKENGGVAGAASTPECKQGFVWRVARPEDLVCVSPTARDRVAAENQLAPALVNPEGQFGPLSCLDGFVWRNAFDGDAVCVTPEARDTAQQENQSASSNRVGG